MLPENWMLHYVRIGKWDVTLLDVTLCENRELGVTLLDVILLRIVCYIIGWKTDVVHWLKASCMKRGGWVIFIIQNIFCRKISIARALTVRKCLADLWKLDTGRVLDVVQHKWRSCSSSETPFTRVITLGWVHHLTQTIYASPIICRHIVWYWSVMWDHSLCLGYIPGVCGGGCGASPVTSWPEGKKECPCTQTHQMAYHTLSDLEKGTCKLSSSASIECNCEPSGSF